MKNICKISILNYLLFLILILSGCMNYLIIYLIIITMHEIGHIIMIKLLGYKIYNIKFNIFGGIINTNININIRSRDLFLISISGIVMQILLSFVIPPFLNTNNYKIFNNLNTLLIFFNILPIFPLDGYKIMLSLIENVTSYKKIIKISYFISLIFIAFLFYKVNNIFICILLLIYNIKNIMLHKYYYEKFLLERYLYPTYKKGLITVKSINLIYKNKYNYINLVNEEEYLKNMLSI